MAVHFVGFVEGSQRFANATLVFGPPAFVHRVWDVRAKLGFGDKIAAMRAAKRAAGARGDCVPYGPASLAYVGRDVTAIMAWREGP